MNTNEALSILAKLWELESIAQTAITPDGRWELLQDWLQDNPAWEKLINQWIELTPNEAFVLLKRYVSERAEIPLVVFDKFITQSIGERVTSAIQKIQTCYRERKRFEKETRKEITA